MSVTTSDIKRFQAEVHRINVLNGWFEDGRTVGDDIALIHSEVSEMLEAYRQWGLEDATRAWEANPKPEGVGSEVADVFIRLVDFAERYGIDVDAEVERKLAYNETRGYRHGGKRL